MEPIKLGIIGLGLAAPIVYPAVFIYAMFQNLSYKVEDFFENLKF